jgi:hypothetical protein
MLFRLRMSIDDTISAYANLANRVFSKKKWPYQEGTYKASLLEKSITDVIAKALKIEKEAAVQTRMLIEKSSDGAKG